MSFDKETRNLLSATVTSCRRRLTVDVTEQLSGTFGMHPDGTTLPLESLTHLSPDQINVAFQLRDLLNHFSIGAEGGDSDRRKTAYERMVLEISFTILNRLAALRICEERDLVIECVRKGTASDGFQMFERISGGTLGGRYDTYKVFLECFFGELAQDLGVLFDRMTPQSAVFPTERCMEDVLAQLNKPELMHLWIEDETIGWVYQYFNPPEERKAMRDASQAPRNSRELAVRNQFFTPRYVVEFLTDNTLGRIWYEMHQGQTGLKDECIYLVRRPKEVFLAPGEKAPTEPESETDLSQEELLKKPVYIEHRSKKDPRDLKILDPACGSGHFLLYAFDLLERIYEEAWMDPESLKSEATSCTLREDFETLDDLQRAAPKLIIEYNLHGIDIDTRAVQIAALALWLRAQKTLKKLGIKADERPQIAKSNIVTAEPMPGEEDMRLEFTDKLNPRVLGQLVDIVFEKMKLAGEAGSLLKIEEEIKDAVAEARKQWLEGPKPEQQQLFRSMVDPKPKLQEQRFDVKGITDDRFWEKAEDRILDALEEYAERAENGHTTRRRLFAEDAARGFAFIDLSRKRYDVVLMNPPFGESTTSSYPYMSKRYPMSKHDTAIAEVERWLEKTTSRGSLGAITTRTPLYNSSSAAWRKSVFFANETLMFCLDLGGDVLDAMVETAAYVLSHSRPTQIPGFLRLNTTSSANKGYVALSEISNILNGKTGLFTIFRDLRMLELLPNSPLAYWLPFSMAKCFTTLVPLKDNGGEAWVGLQTSYDERFLRLWWEVPTGSLGWSPFAKGGSASPYFADVHLVVDWAEDGKRMKAYHCYLDKIGRSTPGNGPRRSFPFYFKQGLTWVYRTDRFHVQALPAGCIISTRGPGIYSTQRLGFLLGYLNSTVVDVLVKVLLGKHKQPQFDVDDVNLIPTPDPCSCEIAESAKNAWQIRLKLITTLEEYRGARSGIPYIEMVNSSVHDLQSKSEKVRIEAIKELTRLQAEIDRDSANIIGVSQRDLKIINDMLFSWDNFGILREDKRGFIHRILSIIFGCSLGRWDVRMVSDSNMAPTHPEIFEKLPVCPPGMLVGSDGLPAKPNRIASEEWLRARPDANTLPPEGLVKKPLIEDSEYPLRISWDGILVDDPGFNGGQLHQDDIVRRVREVLDLLWKDKANDIEQEACDILKISDLRDYFSKPSGFFQDHLKRYSKSRRKAPIYWPISTASGTYTVWIYYHRLTDQTLYTIVNKYIGPKIAEVERGIGRIEDELSTASGREATQLGDRLTDSRTFLGELGDLREELLRIAELPYKPNLNDGVIINAASFHNLFRMRSWAKDTEACWKKLEKGDYDWAHLAYTIWPDRVKDVCRKDRSIAIAHGLEDICEVKAPAPKKKAEGRAKKEATL